MQDASGPPIESIMLCAEKIFAALGERQPDHDRVDGLIHLFTASMGGMHEMMMRCGETSKHLTGSPEGCVQQIRDLRDAVISCMRKIRKLSPTLGPSISQPC